MDDVMTLMTKRHWILKSDEFPSDESYHRALCQPTIARAFCIKLELSCVQRRFSASPICLSRQYMSLL